MSVLEPLNESFYFVIDKIVEMQSYFLMVARYIAYIALFIAVCMAAINYFMTGSGLRENIIKISKALVFYSIVMFAYPNIIGWMTNMTFTLARDSTYASMRGYLNNAARDMQENSRDKEISNKKGTYGNIAINEYDNFFKGIIIDREFTTEDGKTLSYSSVAPAALVRAVMLVAGECLRYGEEKGAPQLGKFPDFLAILKGLVCALLILFVGFFAILEYLVAFIEFMLISSVGVILFPLTLWEGTKFMAEKYITAMVGFFIKLLFCTICIFLMLYGYISLANRFVSDPFTGQIEEIAIVLCSSLMFFYICKSAPGLAQSLLTGSPNLSAAGAINTVVSAGAAVAGVAGLAGAGVGAGVRGVLDASGAIQQGRGAAKAAMDAVGEPGTAGRFGAGARAFGKSMAGQAFTSMKDGASDLTRSLANRPLFGHGAHSYGGGNTGYNPHDIRQQLLTEDGHRKSFGQFYSDRFNAGLHTENKTSTSTKETTAHGSNSSSGTNSAPGSSPASGDTKYYSSLTTPISQKSVQGDTKYYSSLTPPASQTVSNPTVPKNNPPNTSHAQTNPNPYVPKTNPSNALRAQPNQKIFDDKGEDLLS